MSKTYCTTKDLYDVYPNIDEYDVKTPLYSFTKYGTSLYVYHNSGNAESLFIDGKDLTTYKETISSAGTQEYRLNTSIDKDDTTLTVDKETSAEAPKENEVIKIGFEYMLIYQVSGSSNPYTLGVIRGWNGTSPASHSAYVDAGTETGKIYKYSNSSGIAQSWLYSDENDALSIYYGTDLTDSQVEVGPNFKDLVDRMMVNSSRYFESLVDASLPKSMWKDSAGNFDYVIVRTTSLLAISFLLKSQDPTNALAENFNQEAMESIERINQGVIKLGFQVTGDSSQGHLKDVSINESTALRPLETKGAWNGSSYDLLKIKVTAGHDGTGSPANNGLIGNAKFTVWGAGPNKLKEEIIMQEETISGEYQFIGGGMYIRFGSSNIDTAVAYLNDEYELEVWGKYEATDNAQFGAIKSSRRFGRLG